MRHKNILVISIVFLLTASFAHAERDEGIRLPEREELTYQVEWLGIPVGTVVASINGIKNMGGRPAYEIEITARTNEFCSHIYRVNDRYVSYLDKEKLHTLRHEVYRREGRYKKDAFTVFDQINHRAYFKNLLDRSEKNFDIPPDVQDSLTIAYYLRTRPIESGKKIEYTVTNTEANYELFAFIGDKRMVTIPHIGKKEAHFLQPYAKFKGKMEKKGKASGYFSADEKRIPFYIIVEAPLFTKITAYLSKVI